MADAKPILVAEDDALIRMVICDVLTDHGFEPAEAASTAEALALIEAREDLETALIDIDLADHGGGYLVARRMRERRPEARIVYTSGGARADYSRERVDGATFVPKPYHADLVCHLIERSGR